MVFRRIVIFLVVSVRVEDGGVCYGVKEGMVK